MKKVAAVVVYRRQWQAENREVKLEGGRFETAVVRCV